MKSTLIGGRDLDWQILTKDAPQAPCIAVAATDPLYILYTSGTTGKPKGVIRDNGGHAVALKWSMKYIYDVKPGEVFWAASDVGWVVGLPTSSMPRFFTAARRSSTRGNRWEHRIRALSGVLSPSTAYRFCLQRPRRFGPSKRKTRPAITSKNTTSLPSGTCSWRVSAWTRIPTIGRAACSDPRRRPLVADGDGLADRGQLHGHRTVPDQGRFANQAGSRLRRQDTRSRRHGTSQWRRRRCRHKASPAPQGAFPTLWQDDKRYLEYVTERTGYYVTGDGGRFDQDGYIFIMGRIDDVINVAGHRLSTGAMEEIISKHRDVAECAVLGADDQLKGQVPVGFIVLKTGAEHSPDEIVKDLVQMVRSELGALACFKEAAVVAALPKTRSGKILRSTLRKIVDGKDYVVPSTIDDPSVLISIAQSAQTIGYGKK